jgi:16S rRNA processing protein RimM
MLDPVHPPQPWLRVAQVVRPQGHRGEVIADLLTDFPERFAGSPSVHLRAPRVEVPARTVTVERYRLHHGRIVLKFGGVDTMNDAETLRAFDVVVPWEDRVALPEDEVYIAELIGCVLFDAAVQKVIGTILDVDRESSNTDLLVVRPERQAPEGEQASEPIGERKGAESDFLIPYVRAYKPTLDLATRTLHMHLPSGLIDIEPEPSAASEHRGRKSGRDKSAKQAIVEDSAGSQLESSPESSPELSAELPAERSTEQSSALRLETSPTEN